MRRAFRDFVVGWWNQPSGFDWTVQQLRNRGLLRLHQVFMGILMVFYAGISILTAVYPYLKIPEVSYFIVAVAAVSGIGWAFGPFPSERVSALFILVSNLCILGTVVNVSQTFLAMPGLTVLAINGFYIVVLHGPRALTAHLMFSAGSIGWCYAESLRQHLFPGNVTTINLLIVVPIVLGFPVVMQAYLLTLRTGAVAALHDPLTRLNNRRGLENSLDGLVGATVTPVTVLTVDVDRFKAINDTHGHEVGDRVLTTIAECIRAGVADASLDTAAARIGGEEFVIVLRGDSSAGRAVAGRIHAALAADATAPGFTVSIGIATGVCSSATVQNVVHRLIDSADSAMYRAKRAGGNRTEVDRRESSELH